MEGTAEVNESIENSAEAPHLKIKENEHPAQQTTGCNEFQSPTPVVSSGTSWPEHIPSSRSPQTLTEAFAGKDLNFNPGLQSGLAPMCRSPRFPSDPEVMVEELTLKNYKSPKFSMGGSSANADSLPLGLWKNLRRIATEPRDNVTGESLAITDRDDVVNMFLPQLSSGRPLPPAQYNSCYSKGSDHLAESETHEASVNPLTRFPGGVRTKVLSASGFSQLFVRTTLKGKGVVFRHQESQYSGTAEIQNHTRERCIGDTEVASDSCHRPCPKNKAMPLLGGGGGSNVSGLPKEGMSFREWLRTEKQKLNKVERLHIFKQILELVDISHWQEHALQHLRPSYFNILPSNQVKYVGSFIPEDQMQMSPHVMTQDVHFLEPYSKRKRYLEQGAEAHEISSPKHLKHGQRKSIDTRHPVTGGGLRGDLVRESDASFFKSRNSGCDFRESLKLGESCFGRPALSSSVFQHSATEILKLEERWYTSPEESSGSVCPLAANIYSLGVLFFELFCHFESWELHSAAMSDLRHRILPPNFLSESPKETGFCLWLLHPEPLSRPKSRDILLSDLICEGTDMSSVEHSSASIDEEDTQADLLLHFLLILREQKEHQAAKLLADLGCLEADIDEVDKRRPAGVESFSAAKILTSSDSISDLFPPSGSAIVRPGHGLSMSNRNQEKLMRNMHQLENAYFSTRSKVELPETNAAARSDTDVLKIRDKFSGVQNDDDVWDVNKESRDCLGAFFDGFCKYARYKNFEVRGSLRNTDILNSANVICSLSFDRDEEYFAAAGVSKKIKIFEFAALLNDSVDIHYPVIEMSSRSKLSCICWNSYIKNYLASTDFEGVVQLWDASTGQGFAQYTEHQKRAWSVDFSQVNPTRLASGSDDCSVKLWSINEKNCIDTIRNVANVCCVQFSPHSSHLLAFGSADYKIYCYDLRHTRIPWCTLAGHGKAVSYVKFVDSEILVSASTDNTLKLWDLNQTSSSGLSNNACSMTFSGHANEKNFVGLSVSDGYITCGSETNEVYAYYKTLPMPITSHKFGSMDSITGQEVAADNGQFVSSVCWRRKSDMVIAANSSGTIKLLQMV